MFHTRTAVTLATLGTFISTKPLAQEIIHKIATTINYEEHLVQHECSLKDWCIPLANDEVST